LKTGRLAEVQELIASMAPELQRLQEAKDAAKAPADEAEQAFNDQWEGECARLLSPAGHPSVYLSTTCADARCMN